MTDDSTRFTAQHILYLIYTNIIIIMTTCDKTADRKWKNHNNCQPFYHGL